ncbi:MAG: DUF58 domain-containing protein [Panacagrimonas sp.]
MRLRSLFDGFLHPLRWARSRIDAWVLRRVARQPGPITVLRNRIYIVPTRFGWGFGLTCLVTLLGAMNYSNSMAFALSFLLFGLGLVCMHHTHANLVNLQLRAGRAPSVYAGEVAHFEIFIDNPARRARYALSAGWAHDAVDAGCDVPALGFESVRIARAAPQRGWLDAGILSISTEFPLGLFHAWTWVQFDTRCVIFPGPAGSGVPPPQSAGNGGTAGGAHSGQDEFSGLRNYQRGDSLRGIHWKSFPKSGVPMVKQFSDTVERALWLSWDAAPQRDIEARLSQLTRWVLDAETEGRAYGLRLPGTRIAPGRGESHRFECLKALALFGKT